MATYAYTFTSGDTVTPTKLNNARTVSEIVNADISSTAAIVGTKIAPDFGSQNAVTTGNVTAAKLVPTGTSATGNGVFLPAANSVAISTNDSERIRIDASGNVGIGTTSVTSGYVLDGRGWIRAQHPTGDAVIAIVTGNTTGVSQINFGDSAAEDIGTITYAHSSNSLAFRTNNAERMRVTSGGELYIAGTSDQGAYNLQVNGTGVWGAGAYVNGSDERLKDNIAEITEGLEVVKKLRPVSFNYKPTYSKDASKQAGFIAQELLVALAGKDYAEGTVQQGPEFYNVAYQNLIPVMAKAIQELSAKVEALEAAQ